MPKDIVLKPNMLFVERETLCDSAITNNASDFHEVNGSLSTIWYDCTAGA